MSKVLSFPKNKMKVLLLENVHFRAKELFSDESFQVECYSGAMNEAELIDAIQGVHILGIRSKTEVSKSVLEHADKLLAIGAFCIGTNQIDLKTATLNGIAVFNAPYSNTRSVVELAIGSIIMLMRKAIDKNIQLHQQKWDKSSDNCFEIRGKTLGIIGYGHIGSQLSVVAEAIGMQVLYYDLEDKLPLGNAKPVKNLKDLLSISDVVSLHVDGRVINNNLIDDQTLNYFKKGSYLINLSRGNIVDLSALKEKLERKHISGAAIDVFPNEPKTNDEVFSSELQNLPNVILTPHIGGSTSEAQENIGQFVPNKIIQFINNGNTDGSVNIPQVQLPPQQNYHRILHIHKNTAGMLANINQILASHQINIEGQYLKTNEDIGYVIVDIDSNYSKEFKSEIENIPNTIKCRFLF